MWGQKQQAEDRSARRFGSGNGALLSSREAGDAIEKLRSGVEQAAGASSSADRAAA